MHLFAIALIILVVVIAFIYAMWTTAFGAANTDAATPPTTTQKGIDLADKIDSDASIINLIGRILIKSPALIIAKTVATDIKILRFFTPIAATVLAYYGSTMAYEHYGAVNPFIYAPLALLASLSFYYGPKGSHNRLALLSFWCAPVTAQLMAQATGYIPAIAIVINVAFILGWVIEFGKEVRRTYFDKDADA